MGKYCIEAEQLKEMKLYANSWINDIRLILKWELFAIFKKWKFDKFFESHYEKFLLSTQNTELYGLFNAVGCVWGVDFRMADNRKKKHRRKRRR